MFYSGQALKKITPMPGLRLIINKEIERGHKTDWILKIGIFRTYMVKHISYLKRILFELIARAYY